VPDVSVIMPVYNGELTISKSIESVMAQTYQNIELIIVDDLSIDASTSIIKHYSNIHANIVYLTNKYNKGVSGARNTGIECARGRYVCFLDCDDRLKPCSIELRLAALKSNRWDVVYTDFQKILSGGKVKYISVVRFINIHSIYARNIIPNLTGMYDTYRMGKFFQKNVRHEDYVMWHDILKDTKRIGVINISTAFYTVSPYSLSGNKFKAAIWHWKNLRYDFNLSILRSFYFFAQYVIHHIRSAIFER